MQPSTRTRGLTLTEMVVVIGILGVLASLILPGMIKARRNAYLAQCTNNLRQLGQALMMYNIDHSSAIETYPGRLTWMCDLGYVRDERVFLCPMDGTRGGNGQYPHGLKPTYVTDEGVSLPKDNKAGWSESVRVTDVVGGGRLTQRNCSYLYEFNTQPYGNSHYTMVDGKASWTDGWAGEALVGWLDYDSFDPTDPPYNIIQANDVFHWMDFSYEVLAFPADPVKMNREFNGYQWINGVLVPVAPFVTMQDAKFWQLQHGDWFSTGLLDAGYNLAYGADGNGGFSHIPYETTNMSWENQPLKGYPRTWLPIVRCFYHMTPALVDSQDFQEVLNLAVDGNTFFSAPGWEQTAWMYAHIANMGDDSDVTIDWQEIP